MESHPFGSYGIQVMWYNRIWTILTIPITFTGYDRKDQRVDIERFPEGSAGRQAESEIQDSDGRDK